MLFGELDTINKNFLDIRDIYDFLKNNSSSVAYARAERVLKRLDGDLDGKISFDDWITGLLPENRDPNCYSKVTSKKSTQDDRASETNISCSLTESNLQQLALSNIEKLRMMESQKSLPNFEVKRSTFDLKQQEFKINSSEVAPKNTPELMAPEGTYEKNNPTNIFGLKKDADNQMTNRGKSHQVEEKSNVVFDHMRIEKFQHRLQQNGQAVLSAEKNKKFESEGKLQLQ